MVTSNRIYLKLIALDSHQNSPFDSYFRQNRCKVVKAMN